MIKSSQIGRIVSRELADFLLPHGYTAKKAKGELIAAFVKDDSEYYHEFFSYTNRYNDYVLVYGFDFGIASIVKLLREIDQVVPLSTSKYEIRSAITGISPGRLLDPLDTARAYKSFSSEDGLLAIIEEVKVFYRDTYVPFCDKYSRFEELDKLVNSMDEFWVD